jgi:hypothetical protein
VAKVHELFKQSGAKLVDGYAPFCKHGTAAWDAEPLLRRSG